MNYTKRSMWFCKQHHSLAGVWVCYFKRSGFQYQHAVHNGEEKIPPDLFIQILSAHKSKCCAGFTRDLSSCTCPVFCQWLFRAVCTEHKAVLPNPNEKLNTYLLCVTFAIIMWSSVHYIYCLLWFVENAGLIYLFIIFNFLVNLCPMLSFKDVLENAETGLQCFHWHEGEQMITFLLLC